MKQSVWAKKETSEVLEALGHYAGALEIQKKHIEIHGNTFSPEETQEEYKDLKWYESVVAEIKQELASREKEEPDIKVPVITWAEYEDTGTGFKYVGKVEETHEEVKSTEYKIMNEEEFQEYYSRVKKHFEEEKQKSSRNNDLRCQLIGCVTGTSGSEREFAYTATQLKMLFDLTFD